MSEITLVLTCYSEIPVLTAVCGHSACYKSATAGFVPIKKHLYS